MVESKLLTPLQLGSLKLKNKAVLASLTRNRSPGTVPDDVVVEYYKQRSTAGLILSEGVLITPLGTEWPSAPGIWNQEQIDGWKKVTDAVHSQGSFIFAQLWHLGRAVHPLHQCGVPALAPSAIAAKGGKYRLLEGTPGYSTPKEIKDPREIIALYKQAAINAKKAGFDGVELHNANGYLPHEFLESHSNKRTDEWGGSIEARSKFGLTILKELIDVWGDSKRVGIKLSPCGGYNDMGEPLEEAKKLYSYYVQEVDKLNLGYIQIARYLPAFDPTQRGTNFDAIAFLAPFIKKSLLFVNGSFEKLEEVDAFLEKAPNGPSADAIVFGRPFVANPDFPHRLVNGLELKQINWGNLYGINAPDGTLVKPSEGYTDY